MPGELKAIRGQRQAVTGDRPMTIAVTGGTGFIGAAIVRTHLARGDTVRVLTRRRPAPAPAGATWLQGDLATGDIPRAFTAGADVLYHCAGELRDEGRMRALHVEGTRALLTRAAGVVGRWVQLSSVGVYGPRRRGTVTEDTPEAPRGTYERTKAESDGLVRRAHEQGDLQTVILRPSIVFGPEMPNRSLFSLIEAVRRGMFAYVGPPGASASYIPLENVIHALVLCARLPAAAGEVFDLSACTPMERFIGSIAAALGAPAPRLRLPRLPVRIAAAAFSVLPGWPLSVSRVDALTGRATYSTAHIEQTLGYRHALTVDEALVRTVAHWRRMRGDA